MILRLNVICLEISMVFAKVTVLQRQVFEYITYLHKSFEKQKYSSSIFVDYSKAFDPFNHNILLKKLRLYNLVYGCTTGVHLGTTPIYYIYINDVVYELYNCEFKMILYMPMIPYFIIATLIRIWQLP